MLKENLFESIYLGDRFCKKIIIDNELDLIKLEINCISRIRSEDGMWNFYNEENIENGFIVFAEVKEFNFIPNGLITNDAIKLKELIKIGDNYISKIIFETYNAEYNCSIVELEIVSEDVFLENPLLPGIKIR